jgi:hypothetical protein
VIHLAVERAGAAGELHEHGHRRVSILRAMEARSIRGELRFSLPVEQRELEAGADELPEPERHLTDDARDERDVPSEHPVEDVLALE